VRRDGKMPVALLEDIDQAIISQAYPVFEIIDTKVLLPQYLMMGFSRSEFDRQATFHAVGGVRGSLEWEDFLAFELPVPSIEKQREIVREYNVIENRITLNQQLNKKLEETAQTLYKHWFVDFNFPITKENCPELVSGSPELIGRPYKSSGGKMVYNEELKKEIPKGWEPQRLDFIAKICAGGDRPKVFSENETLKNRVPIYSNSSVKDGIYGYTNLPKINEPSITISARGAIIGFTVLRTKPFFPIIRLIVITPNDNYQFGFLYNAILNFKFDNQTSSAQGQLTIPDISSYKIMYPKISVLKMYQKQFEVINERIEIFKKEIEKHKELKDILLSKMVKVEEEKNISCL
jgi:type I restriction enzyme S subunit